MNMLREMSKDEFEARAKTGKRVAVHREFLSDRETPVAVLTRAAEDESVFLLESVSAGVRRGRYSFLGVDPKAVVTQRGGKVTLTEAGGAARELEGDILEALRGLLAEEKVEADEGLPPLQGGAIGYLSYDAVKGFEPKVGLKEDPGTPQGAFMLTDTVLVFDDVRQTVTVVAVADPKVEGACEKARARIEEVYGRLLSAESIARWKEAHPAGAGPKKKVGEFAPEMSREEYAGIVAKCKAAIAEGECIQVVPSQKFTAETDVDGLSLYRALRLVNPSPYIYLKLGGKELVGSSPEELVSLRGGGRRRRRSRGRVRGGGRGRRTGRTRRSCWGTRRSARNT